MFVAERIADGADPLAHPQHRRVAERRDRQAGLAVDLDQRDVGVGIAADEAGPEASSIRQLDRDAIGAFDDVVVRQDAAVGVDDEAGAFAAPRLIGIPPRLHRIERRVERLRSVFVVCLAALAARATRLTRRVDVDDSRIDACDDVREVDEGAEGNAGPAEGDTLRLGARLDRRARNATGENRADKKGDRGRQPD